jgi:hypothetical protein
VVWCCSLEAAACSSEKKGRLLQKASAGASVQLAIAVDGKDVLPVSSSLHLGKVPARH